MRISSYTPVLTRSTGLQAGRDCGCAKTDRAEARQVAELRARDREVRSHEQAHRAAGGEHISGGVHLDYQRGPDGRYYAAGGDVSVSTSPVPGDPEATLRKMETVRRAALAPAEPSSQDLKVAAQAAAAASRARLELNSTQGADSQGAQATELSETGETGPDDDDGGRTAAQGAGLAPAVQAYGAIASIDPADPARLLDLRA